MPILASHRKSRGTGGVRSTSPAVGLTTAALASVTLLSAQSADAAPSAVSQPSVEDVQKKVDALYRQAGSTTRQYEQAKEPAKTAKTAKPDRAARSKEAAAETTGETRAAQAVPRQQPRRAAPRQGDAIRPAAAMTYADGPQVPRPAPVRPAPTRLVPQQPVPQQLVPPQLVPPQPTRAPRAVPAQAPVPSRAQGAEPQAALRLKKLTVQEKLVTARALLSRLVQEETARLAALERAQDEEARRLADVRAQEEAARLREEQQAQAQLAQQLEAQAQQAQAQAQAEAEAQAQARAAQAQLDAQARAEAQEALDQALAQQAQAQQLLEAQAQTLQPPLAPLAPLLSAVPAQPDPVTLTTPFVTTPAPAPDSTYATKAAKVLAFARAQIGKPYVSGATGPSSYDSTGLTQTAWRVAGVDLPRTTWEQVGAGTNITTQDLLPGDLVFFYDDISHVGIYTGDGMMIHAPEPGANVREESIYYLPIHGSVRPA
ncbi:NlpC/P60 family protein [Streptomyces sp. NBC_01317]|uniref:C40 family peptidase n=1 Tax=Streptomyces sp. NBC_01317 TaxID=2903822 RepID=UPI002E105202|nr:NlpC/P60 family protein [Streptomyces sp. NBC_01317]